MRTRLPEPLTPPSFKRQKLLHLTIEIHSPTPHSTSLPMQPLFPESHATPMQSTASLSVKSKITEVFSGNDRIVSNSKVSSNGTFTPISSYEGTNGSTDVNMEVVSTEVVTSTECPCGFMHGPGQGDHLDIKAIGFSNLPLMRGPE